MSTNFLNRRMDLHHSGSILTMDTSYPVKLAGKVLKLFTATSDFKSSSWTLNNSEGETILSVSEDKVYDFAGRILKDSIGEGKAYATVQDVWKNDDYVMVIIDFDNFTMHFCSQTNFEDFITGTGAGDCDLKLFDITGDEDMTGYTYKIDTSVFDAAVEFDNEEDKHALLRNSEDDVVYEIPVNITDDEGNITQRTMTPVANLDCININGINVSIQNLVFPFINMINSDVGMENVTGMHSFKKINGTLNDTFIEKFCFTYNELTNLGMWKSEDHTAYIYFKDECEYIPEEDRNKYYYVLTDTTSGDNWSSNQLDSSMMFKPINIDTMKFSSYSNISNNGIYVNGNNTGLSFRYTKGDILVGSWWDFDNHNGFVAYNIEGGVKRIHVKDFITGDNFCPYDAFLKTRNLSSSGMIYRVTYSSQYVNDTIFKNEIMNDVSRFIDFFTGGNNSYKTYIRKRICCIENDTIEDIATFKVSDPYHKLIKNIVIVYPELFENVLFDKDGNDFSHSEENLSNFESFYNDNTPSKFDRTSYEFFNNSFNNIDETRYFLYLLFNKNNEKNVYTGEAFSNDKNTIKINGISSKLKIKRNVPILGNDGSDQFITTDKSGNYLMLNIISRVGISSMGTPYYSDDQKPNYNNAQFGIQDILVTRKIKFANEHIKYSDGKYKIYPYGFDNSYGGFDLKILINSNYNIDDEGTSSIDENDGEEITGLSMKYVTKDLFKNNEKIDSNDTGFMYMYYIDTAATQNYIYRIKYYFNPDDTNSNEENDYISSYDYYTSTFIADIKVATKNEYSKSNHPVCVRAYVNYKVHYLMELDSDLSSEDAVEKAFSDANQIISTNPNLFIKTIVKAYNFYPINTDIVNKYYKNSELDASSTCDLAIPTRNSRNDGVDIRYFAAAYTNNDSINDGFKIKELLNDNSLVLYENHLAPYVSNTLNSSNSYIYNVKTYIDYIKSTKINKVIHIDDFPYINGKGIRECYYKNNDGSFKSLYEFYNYILTRDLSIPIDNPDSLLDSQFNKSNTAFFTRQDVQGITIRKTLNDKGTGYNDNFYSTTSNNKVTLKSSITLKNNVEISSIYGLNNSELVDNNGNDVSKTYSSEDVIYINKEQAGSKTTYGLAISDGETKNSTIVSINGSMGEIEVDKLTWETLLLALNNDKTINILSDSFIDMKTELNNYIYLAGQNISDTISIVDNNNLEDNANSHDDIYGSKKDEDGNIYDKNGNLISKSTSTGSFQYEHYKDKNAEFDEKHNLYNFNYGYGYSDDNKTKTLNNRGVIVFVTEGAYTKCNDNGNSKVESFTYDFHNGSVYPKRMYISKDGLICTKEYFDNDLLNGTYIPDDTLPINNITMPISLDEVIDEYVNCCQYLFAYLNSSEIYDFDPSFGMYIKYYNSLKNKTYYDSNIIDFVSDVLIINRYTYSSLYFNYNSWKGKLTDSKEEVYNTLNSDNNNIYNNCTAESNYKKCIYKFIENSVIYLNEFLNYIKSANESFDSDDNVPKAITKFSNLKKNFLI
jgi:hypothetical protein